jgi:hypothetical protein
MADYESPSSAELASLDESGAPPKRRIKNAANLIAMNRKYEEQDSEASRKRAAAQAMLDGKPPWTEKELRSKGLGSIINENFGEAKAIRDSALAPYTEMLDNVPRYANITLGIRDTKANYEKSQIVSEEWDATIKKWDDYRSRIMQIQNGFVGDGVSIAMFPDERGMYFRPCYLRDFKIPRDTPSSDQDVEIATVTRTMSVSELYRYIRNPEIAKKVGWNPAAVKEAILRARPNNDEWSDAPNQWETFEQEVKENDLYQGEYGYNKVRLIYGYYREFPDRFSCGKYSQAIAVKDVNDFLYERLGKFGNVNECFIIFPYGIGEGTFHTIRGLKHAIYSHVQISNRLISAAVQGSLLSMQVMLQGSAAAIQGFQPLEIGPYSFISEGLTPMSIVQPNIANQGFAAYNLLQMMLQNNTGTYQARAVTPDSSGNRSATEVRAQIVQQNVLGSAAMTLFHTPYSKLHREMFHRAISDKISQSDEGGKLAYDFRARCLRRGVTIDDLRTVETVKTVQSLGNGSAQMQQQAADMLMQLLPTLDPYGRAMALNEKLLSIPGITMDKAREFVALEGPRMGVDLDIANIENQFFQQGLPSQITPEQNDYVHLQSHIPFMEQIIAAFEQGQMPIEQAIQILEPAGNNATDHAVALSQDGTMKVEAAEMRRQLQNVMAFVKEQRQRLINKAQSEAEAAVPAEGEGGSMKEQFELQKMQFELQKMQADADRKTKEHEQKMEQIRQQIALADAKAASSMAGNTGRPVGRPTLIE